VAPEEPAVFDIDLNADQFYDGFPDEDVTGPFFRFTMTISNNSGIVVAIQGLNAECDDSEGTTTEIDFLTDTTLYIATGESETIDAIFGGLSKSEDQRRFRYRCTLSLVGWASSNTVNPSEPTENFSKRFRFSAKSYD